MATCCVNLVMSEHGYMSLVHGYMSLVHGYMSLVHGYMSLVHGYMPLVHGYMSLGYIHMSNVTRAQFPFISAHACKSVACMHACQQSVYLSVTTVKSLHQSTQSSEMWTHLSQVRTLCVCVCHATIHMH